MVLVPFVQFVGGDLGYICAACAVTLDYWPFYWEPTVEAWKEAFFYAQR